VAARPGKHRPVGGLSQDFLRGDASRAARHLSLAGFDDRPESFSRGITSYNFNIQALAAALVRHILYGESRQMPRQNGVIYVPGFIAERQSTFPPKQAG